MLSMKTAIYGPIHGRAQGLPFHTRNQHADLDHHFSTHQTLGSSAFAPELSRVAKRPHATIMNSLHMLTSISFSGLDRRHFSEVSTTQCDINKTRHRQSEALLGHF